MTYCEACRASLNIFIRKKCSACCQVHCSRCLTMVAPESASARGSLVIRGRSRRVCVKCAMLISGDYSREDLASRYSVRELRTFLVRSQVTLTGCTEKADLIELAMKASHGHGHNVDRDDDHARHVEQLKEKMMTELISGENQADDSPSPPDAPVVTSADADDQSQNVDGILSDDNSGLHSNDVDSRSVSDTVLLGAVDNDVTAHTDVTDTRTTHSAPTSSTASPFHVSSDNRQHITLSDITDTAAIDQLTVRQLKELLVRNYVDYKGCCEKAELLMRVRELWNDRQRNINYVENATSSTTEGTATTDFDSNLCKVCMDAVIDCLLLECGHMVTCTDCGKKLAECPICRRYVVRVVHVFRA